MISQVQNRARILPKKLILVALNSLHKLVPLFIKLKISANALTIAALLVGIGAGALFALAHPIWAGILIIFCGILDVLDGKVAVESNHKSLFGAIFDSTLDRYSEFFIYFGLAIYFRNHWALWLIFWTFLGSSMVSYTRARSEGLGIECKIGVMQRAERLILLSLGAIVGSIFNVFDTVAIAILAGIALVSNFVAFQRIFHVKRVEKQRKISDEFKKEKI